MRFSVAAAAVLSAAVSAQAQNNTWNVIVGANETLTFTPNNLTGVQNGDIVSFQFVSKNHSVTQSSFANPCTANGVSSGFQDVADVNASTFPTWSITIENNTSPLWFFCAQTTNTSTHCQSGMVFAINPTAAKNFSTFQTLAMTPNTTLPAGQNPPGTVVTATGVDGPLSAGGVSSQTSEAASPAGTSSPSSGGNGTSTSGNGTSSSNTTSGSPPANTNAAMKMSGSSISLLTVAGLVAGLAL